MEGREGDRPCPSDVGYTEGLWKKVCVHVRKNVCVRVSVCLLGVMCYCLAGKQFIVPGSYVLIGGCPLFL